MKSIQSASLAAVLAAAFLACSAPKAEAGYYSGYSYYPSRGYYYSYYYYKPYPTYPSYNYHYAVYYPRYPRYVYYYNPYRRVYWGRYDLEAKGYSKLEDKDQKATLAEIPETAFPKPGAMPAVPESTDGSTIETPPAPPQQDQPQQ
jgi:hypothetical protein